MPLVLPHLNEVLRWSYKESGVVQVEQSLIMEWKNGGVKMKAGQIMQKPVLATTPRASVRDIALQLVTNGISGMPVVERDGTVRGIVTEADILRVQAKGKQFEALTAQDIMSANPIAVDVETPIDDVKILLMEYHILRVPVVENGKLVGIISRRDIIKAMLQPEFLIF